jgi:hypothetical protein
MEEDCTTIGMNEEDKFDFIFIHCHHCIKPDIRNCCMKLITYSELNSWMMKIIFCLGKKCEKSGHLFFILLKDD